MTADIVELLRSMPDLEPPADGWRRVAARQVRLSRMRWRGGLAAAASVIIVATAGFLILQQREFAVAPTGPSVIEPIIVSAPAMQPEVREADAQVRAWQQRSQYMERLLGELPARARIARADMAGVIAELEDRIAAVDYQLNRVGWSRAMRSGGGVERQRVPADGSRYQPAEASDLWRRRVEFMDQLVRARYLETGASGF